MNPRIHGHHVCSRLIPLIHGISIRTENSVTAGTPQRAGRLLQPKPNRETYTEWNMQREDGKQGIQVMDICKLHMYVHVGKSGLGLGRACVHT